MPALACGLVDVLGVPVQRHLADIMKLTARDARLFPHDMKRGTREMRVHRLLKPGPVEVDGVVVEMVTAPKAGMYEPTRTVVVRHGTLGDAPAPAPLVAAPLAAPAFAPPAAPGTEPAVAALMRQLADVQRQLAQLTSAVPPAAIAAEPAPSDEPEVDPDMRPFSQARDCIVPVLYPEHTARIEATGPRLQALKKAVGDGPARVCHGGDSEFTRSRLGPRGSWGRRDTLADIDFRLCDIRLQFYNIVNRWKSHDEAEKFLDEHMTDREWLPEEEREQTAHRYLDRMLDCLDRTYDAVEMEVMLR